MGVSAELEHSLHEQNCAVHQQSGRAVRISGMVRSIIREELCAVLRQLPVQPVEEESASEDGMDDTIMDFLKSFG